MKPIYYSKVIFHMIAFSHSPVLSYNSTIILNLNQKELCLRKYKIQRYYPHLLVSIKNYKTDSKKIILPSIIEKEEDYFTHVIQLTDQQIKDLLPLCNALEFEPYRNKEMKYSDEGCIGHLDCAILDFYGITNSYLPLIHLPMSYVYDNEHLRPNEKLYRYLNKTFFSDKKHRN